MLTMTPTGSDRAWQAARTTRITPQPVAKSHIFSRCHCGGLAIRGVCQSCGWVHECMVCGAVRQGDGLTWAKVVTDSGNRSSGVCPGCRTAYLARFFPNKTVDKTYHVRYISTILNP